MNKNNDWKKSEEIEIDLADLIKRLCMKWKQILICALAFAVLAGGYGYLKNKSRADLPQLDEGEEIELTQEEQQSVLSAVQLQAENAGLEQYLETSLLMKADPYHKHKTYMLYSIEQADRRDVQKITESYLSFVMYGGAADALKKTGREWDLDKSCLAEIMTAYQRNYSYPYQVAVEEAAGGDMQAEAVFYIDLTALDEQMAVRFADAMQEVLEAHAAQVKKQAGSHRLKLVSTEHAVVADSNLQVQQHDKRAQLAANKASLKTMTEAFSETQLAVYEKETQLAGEQRETDDGSETESLEEETAAGGSLSSAVRYGILGFAGGMFLYCCIFGCWYLFRDTVKSAREMKELYTFPFYGGIPSKKQIPAESGVQAGMHKAVQLVNRVRLACKKQDITRLCLASDFALDDREREWMKLIAGQLKESGIDAVSAENAGSDTALWDMLAETGTVILVCRMGTTTHRMIDDAMRFYRENGVAVIGAMAFACEE